MKLSALFAALTLAAASVALAQTAQTPPTTNQAKKEMQAQKQDPLAIQSSDAEDWNQIKGHDKGYVSKSDALPNSWLAQNFMACDEDHDGKVTQAEYAKCAKKR
jgi:hypothetical protein